MKKHRNRHTSFIPMGNEIATPVTTKHYSQQHHHTKRRPRT